MKQDEEANLLVKGTTTPTCSSVAITKKVGQLDGNRGNIKWYEQARNENMKTQSKLPQHPNVNYARKFQQRFDMHIELDSLMDDAESKDATFLKIKAMFIKILEEDNSATLYPYSISSSAVPVTAMV